MNAYGWKRRRLGWFAVTAAIVLGAVNGINVFLGYPAFSHMALEDTMAKFIAIPFQLCVIFSFLGVPTILLVLRTRKTLPWWVGVTLIVLLGVGILMDFLGLSLHTAY